MEMDPERWRRVKEIFECSRELKPLQREEYLLKACKAESDLRTEVDSLLSALGDASEFLEGPGLAELPEVLLQALHGHVSEEHIGPYRILKEIGWGGMGTVYLASRADNQFQRCVAIKVIKRGMDTDSIVRRFLNERQILAGLNHPNIAKLLDGGATSDGLPFFVMEYVEGKPIDEECDAKRLSIDQRLKLFREVCSAVQYAHQNLVVHRDIKPANILVTREGAPKLLDFGVAKLLNAGLSSSPVDLTVIGLNALTPFYASPEQLCGEPVTTVSDVFALGILLYELLSGHHPFKRPNLETSAVVQIVCHEEPAPPSAVITSAVDLPVVSAARGEDPGGLPRRLRGDLDNIVLKALRKDPHERYGSAEQLSDDILRYLEERPVTARKSTSFYWAGKAIKRHKTAAVALGVCVILVLTGAITTLREAYIANLERQRAERRFADVRKLANSYLFEFHDAIENLPGSLPARQLLVKRALEYLNKLVQESSRDTGLQRELAAAYEKIGDVQGRPDFANLGNSQSALESYYKALSLRQDIVRDSSSSVSDELALQASYSSLGLLLVRTGDLGQGVSMTRKALDICQQLASAHPSDTRIQMQLATVHDLLGDMQAGVDALGHVGDPAAAMGNHRKALAVAESLLTAHPGNLEINRLVAHIQMKVGDALARQGRASEALALYRKSLQTSESIAVNSLNLKFRRSVANSLYRICDALETNADPAKALESCQRALEISQSLAAADPKNIRARVDVADGEVGVGELQAKTGDPRRGLGMVLQGILDMEGLAAADPHNAEIKASLAAANLYAGDIRGRMKDDTGAIENFNAGLLISRQMAASDSLNVDARVNAAVALNKIAGAWDRKHNAAKALKSYRDAVAILEPVKTATPSTELLRLTLAESYFGIGNGLSKIASSSTEEWRKARNAYQQCLQVYETLQAQAANRGRYAKDVRRVSIEVARSDAALKTVH